MEGPEPCHRISTRVSEHNERVLVSLGVDERMSDSYLDMEDEEFGSLGRLVMDRMMDDPQLAEAVSQVLSEPQQERATPAS